MELRSQEDDSQEESQNPDVLRLIGHLIGKTELRTEWLRGQAISSVTL